MKKAIIATIPSDCHSWNLLYMECFLKEQGFSVVNLGVCTPIDLLVETCNKENPNLVVISTINGHGCIEGIELIQRLQPMKEQRQMPVVIGGNLCTTPQDIARHATALQLAGFDRVYFGDDSITEFQAFLETFFKRRIGSQKDLEYSIGPVPELYRIPSFFSDQRAVS